MRDSLVWFLSLVIKRNCITTSECQTQLHKERENESRRKIKKKRKSWKRNETNTYQTDVNVEKWSDQKNIETENICLCVCV
jgi:hypothetical protein